MHSVAAYAIFTRSGRTIPNEELRAIAENDRHKEEQVSLIRLEQIKMKNRLMKLESHLKRKEELAEGLHLIDFEQLKIENQTYNEKIEERDEELLKLRKKITDTVQVLTHLKEKMNFIHMENTGMRGQLMAVEERVARRRDVISLTKHARDKLRQSNSRLFQQSGMLGMKDLLHDYEVSSDLTADLNHRIETLKRQHAELSLKIGGVKKKISSVKLQQQQQQQQQPQQGVPSLH